MHQMPELTDLGIELHFPVCDQVIRTSDGELAGPEKLRITCHKSMFTGELSLRSHLTVLLLSLTEPLNGPGKRVLHILTHLVMVIIISGF